MRALEPLPPVLQPPAPPLSAPGQHTPEVPAEMQPKPLGHAPAVAGSHEVTQYLLPVPSSPQLSDTQSELLVQVEPRPPVVFGPASQVPFTQTWLASVQPPFVHD